jgi:hypothetical protein
MNIFILITAVISLVTLFGHSIIGKRQYLDKMLAVSFDPVAKRMLTFGFYYVSATLFTATLFFAYVWFAKVPKEIFGLAAFYIAIQFASVTVLHILIAGSSGIKRWFVVMYHWFIFGTIAISAGISVYI